MRKSVKNLHGCGTVQLEKDMDQKAANRSIRARHYPFKLRGFRYDARTGKAAVYG